MKTRAGACEGWREGVRGCACLALVSHRPVLLGQCCIFVVQLVLLSLLRPYRTENENRFAIAAGMALVLVTAAGSCTSLVEARTEKQ